MRCDCCNKKLSPYESTLRHAESRAFLDTCLSCLDGLGIPYVGRSDLSKTIDDDGTDEECGLSSLP